MSNFLGEKKGDYPDLGKEVIVLKGTPRTWDENKIHTLSIVVANRGYKYWSYYGLHYYDYKDVAKKGKAGIAWSNDLIHWVKYPGNPIIESNCRWPTVVLVDGVFHMFYTCYNPRGSSILKVISEDGFSFSQEQVVVPLEPGLQNQNPFIFFNPLDQCYYLFYYHGRERGPAKKIWNIYVRVAKDMANLTQTEAIVLLSSPNTLAAPSVAYYNGRYYLTVEAFEQNKWVTRVFESLFLTRGFKEVRNSPILLDNDACCFQYIFDGKLYIYYSHCYDQKKNFWDLRMRKET